MTSSGSPYSRFRRALATGNLAVVRAAAAELPAVDLADALARLWRSGRYGVWHLANAGVTTWLDVARWVVQRAGVDVAVTPITTAELARPAPRPGYSVLDDGYWAESGFAPLRPWPDALAEAFEGVSGAEHEGGALTGRIC